MVVTHGLLMTSLYSVADEIEMDLSDLEEEEPTKPKVSNKGMYFGLNKQ